MRLRLRSRSLSTWSNHFQKYFYSGGYWWKKIIQNQNYIDKMSVEDEKTVCLRDLDTGAYFFLSLSNVHGLHIYLLTETVKDGKQLYTIYVIFCLIIYMCMVCLAGALWLWSLFTICKRWANSKLFTLLVFVYIEFVCVSVDVNGFTWIGFRVYAQRHSWKWPPLKLSVSLKKTQMLNLCQLTMFSLSSVHALRLKCV